MSSQNEKRCAECDHLILGRVDKRFCSDQCRNAFNNRINRDVTSYVKNTNRSLRKNRRILMELNPGGKTKVAREKLLAKGFDFEHFTSTYTTREGVAYRYCYEQGYLPIDRDYFLLVIKKEF